MKILTAIKSAFIFSAVAQGQVNQGLDNEPKTTNLRNRQNSTEVTKVCNEDHNKKDITPSQEKTNSTQNNGNINFVSAFEFAGTINQNYSDTLYPNVNIGLGADYETPNVCTQSLEKVFFAGKRLSLDNPDIFTGKKIASVDGVRSAIESFCGAAEQPSGSKNSANSGSINLSNILDMLSNGVTTPAQNLLLLLNIEFLLGYPTRIN